MHAGFRMLTALGLAAGSVCLASAAGAQQARHDASHVSGDAKLRAEAKVGEADARATALKQVPKGKIESGEIERENGRLIFSFDIKAPGKSGIEEVNVDAMTGAVIAHEHESPKAERAEAAKEARPKMAVRKP